MFFEFSFPCFGLLWLLIIKKPFLAFTGVLRKIFGSLTRKVWEFEQHWITTAVATRL